jgi:glycine dehydrogenase subunit 1
VTRYTAITPQDLKAMLAAIGVGSLEELFARQIPAEVALRGELALPSGMAEQDVYEHLRELAERNVSGEQEISFVGAGMYDHYVPALVDMLCERSEFLTPYTPYQPEVSQGHLQVMFEYQTAISELTALPVSNGSVYEGPSAVASAAYMAKLHNGRGRFVVSQGLHPHSLQTLRTYARGFDAEVVEVPIPPGGDGRTDTRRWREAIDGRTCAAIFAQPNFYGVVEDAPALSALAKEGAGAEDALVIAQVDPMTLGMSQWARARRSAGALTSAGPRSVSSPRLRSSCASCRAGSPGRRAISTAAEASCSRCRPASNTSGARGRRRTSAPRRR